MIVAGGGHNGLVCAAYLARAGLDTVVVEARDSVGGCASTVADLGARFNVCNCDHTMIRAMPIADELDLAAHGLRYLENEAGSINRFHDGSPPWVFFHDIDRHLATLASTHPGQVPAYRRYLADALPVAELVIEMARTVPSLPRMLLRGTRRAHAAARLVAWSRRSATDVLGEYFDDWHLSMPGIATGPTVWGVAPTVPGTGTAAVGYATRHLVRTGRPAGGSGALTDAVRGSFEAAGGRVVCGRRVTSLLVDDGAVSGVRLDDGHRIHARVVVAATDPRSVLLEWLGDPPSSASRRLVRGIEEGAPQSGYESKIDAVLARPPRYRASVVDDAIPGVDQLGPTNVISPSPDQLADAHRRRNDGTVATFPTLMINVPSMLDPAMRTPEGDHVLSVEVLFTPYEIAGGWPASKEPERWLEVAAGLMEPGSFAVDRWRAMTPDRYEREFAMARGHAPSFSASPLSVLVGRQRARTRYRTPVGGLYLTGAGTFPGAGIFGASGRNAASVVERDVRRRDSTRGRRIARMAS